MPALSPRAAEFVDREERAACNAESVKKLLRRTRRHWSVVALADHFDVSPRMVRDVIRALEDAGTTMNVSDDGLALSADIPKAKATVIDRSSPEKEIIFGVTADNHLCSKYARIDVLEALFSIWADAGVKDVYQGGNMIDGEARFNVHDLVARGVEGQIEYFIEHWPRREGITTHYVTGDDHEGWYVQRDHIDIGRLMQDRAMQAGRTDLHYLGHMEHDIELRAPKGSAIMLLMHAGGGSTYATSYTSQKLAESFGSGDKPQVMLIGHYHKAEYCYPREIHALQLGATQDQSPWMRKKKIASNVGGWTVRLRQDEYGIITSFQVQWHPFYDRGFYTDKKWRYHWNAKHLRAKAA